MEAESRKWEAQLRRLDREDTRLVDAYQAEAITLEELKERRGQLQNRRQILAAQRDQSARLHADRQAAEGAWQELTTFCDRIRGRLEELTPIEKQRVLQLLVERVLVGETVLEIRHVIPLRQLRAQPFPLLRYRRLKPHPPTRTQPSPLESAASTSYPNTWLTHTSKSPNHDSTPAS